jgi:hypothetical protein
LYKRDAVDRFIQIGRDIASWGQLKICPPAARQIVGRADEHVIDGARPEGAAANRKRDRLFSTLNQT